jgi:hypothetical protein
MPSNAASSNPGGAFEGSAVRVDPREQALDGERLAERPEDTGVLLGGIDAGVGRQDQDREVWRVRMFIESPQELEPVHARHAEVQEDQAGAGDLFQLVERNLTVLRLDDGPPRAPQDVRDAVADVWIILDEQDRSVGWAWVRHEVSCVHDRSVDRTREGLLCTPEQGMCKWPEGLGYWTLRPSVTSLVVMRLEAEVPCSLNLANGS